ncbi:RrF2 family transcriptional regulator [Psychromonas sp. PT13]|uniref:RrF2 family transcriptional regulator n=1 Tax=Psychromonas sp. PT13 TaxID=3439547 RepID=UPI003EBD9851
MQLTKLTDYGFKVLIFLANKPEKYLASIDEIANTYQLPKNSVVKVIHQLGKGNIIETRRGKGGGFLLAKKPIDIKISDVVSLLEGDIDVVDCASHNCYLQSSCQLKGIINKATFAFLDVLKEYSIEDLISHQQHGLFNVVNIEPNEI